MSVDPAHSLADAFDLETSLFHDQTGDPLPIDDRLAIHEVNIQKEIKRHWREISAYVISVLRTTGISDVEAEELAILPGMEELSAMMYVNQYRREERYDVIVLDCAPTAESMRFVSMPTTLEWYMKHIFPFQRGSPEGRAAPSPIASRPSNCPPTAISPTSRNLFGKLEGIGELLEDPNITSVRLVTNPEKMVLRETQRAFVYFSLHGLTVDGIIVNRVLPGEVTDAWFDEWRASQAKILEEIEEYFAPVPVKRVPLFTHEVLGRERLEELAARSVRRAEKIPPPSRAPKRPTLSERRTATTKSALQLPFAAKGEIGLFKKGDELVVGDRHPAPPHRPADLHGRATTRQSQTRKPHPDRRNEGGSMTKQQRANQQTEHESHQRASGVRGERCVCNEVFDHLKDAFGVPPAAKEHLANSRLEFLKAIREVIDSRIEKVSKAARQGTKIAVE